MEAHLLLGIDAGLSMTKAALFDRSGREVAAASVPDQIQRAAASRRFGRLDADHISGTGALIRGKDQFHRAEIIFARCFGFSFFLEAFSQVAMTFDNAGVHQSVVGVCP